MDLRQEAPYKQEVAEATVMLVQAFGACVEELFRKPLIITSAVTNPFAELPKHVQLSIVQSAFTKGLAQCLASLAMLSDGAVEDKDVLNMGRLVLKMEFDQYVKVMRRGNETRKEELGKGADTGPASDGPVPDLQPQGSQDQQG